MQRVVILGTGGTIAGTAASATDSLGYRAASLGVEALVAAVPALAGEPLECEQLAQLDSKDMDHATWRALAERAAAHLGRDEVAGVVVTHGSDTLEETAEFLHRVLRPAKPLVLTAAMRPASSLQADGPQNLLDALRVAREPGARGVVAVVAGRIVGAEDLRKLHGFRLDAFGAGEAGDLGVVEQGVVRRFREWPAAGASQLARLPADAARWPRVEIVASHAGADGAIVGALVAAGVDGLVVACTGNGTVHAALEAALVDAAAAGVRVVRATRCAFGPVNAPNGRLPPAASPVPAKARVALLLELMGVA